MLQLRDHPIFVETLLPTNLHNVEEMYPFDNLNMGNIRAARTTCNHSPLIDDPPTGTYAINTSQIARSRTPSVSPSGDYMIAIWELLIAWLGGMIEGSCLCAPRVGYCMCCM